MTKHIVIVDGAWSGHHGMYVRVLAQTLLAAGHKVSVLCPAPEEMQTWAREAVPGKEGKFNVYRFVNRTSSPRTLIARFVYAPLQCLLRWQHLSRSLASLPESDRKPDLVFFAWMDIYLNCRFIPAWLVDKWFPYPWSGLYFHPRHHRDRQRSFFPAKLERLVARSRFACSLAILDAGVATRLQANLKGKPVYVFPDFSDEAAPAEDYPVARGIRQRAGSRKIIGLLGGLTKRKGLLNLLEIIRQEASPDWYFVIAGNLVEQNFSARELSEVRQFLEHPRSNCFVHLGSIPEDAQFNALVQACDVIFAMYRNFPHSSNLVTKAAAFGKPILVSAGGYMEEVVRQYHLGEVVPDNGDLSLASAALDRLVREWPQQERLAGMQAYAQSQSQNALRLALSQLVDHCVS